MSGIHSLSPEFENQMFRRIRKEERKSGNPNPRGKLHGMTNDD
jgi:hypothetical protein